MTDSQRLGIRRSEIRQRLNELQGADALTDATRTEVDKLSTEYRDVETRWRAAVSLEDVSVDGAGRELSSMEARADMGRYFDSVMSHAQVDGVEKELQDNLHLKANMVPTSLLFENRAVTPAPGNVNANQNRIIPYVFPTSVAASLNIPMPTVGVGEQIFPVLSNPANVRTPAEGGSAAETTGSFTAAKLKPQRLQASFYWSREDEATFAGMGDALRSNLRAALSDKLDDYILSDATVGLLGGGLTAPSNPTAESTWADYKSGISALVDGRYADSEADVSVVFGSATWAKMRTVYRTATASDDDAITSIRGMGASVRVSAHVPAPGTNRQGAIASRGTEQHATAPIWSGITLIPDEITKAATGEIVLTAVMLAQFMVLRTDGFSRLLFDIR